ncbi:uncharacterized protein [Haliotis cracherodii]|uniref:uncharacterized protein n=1 Tax=Haliotis cracherodii TaxID=6455 RepID=UPI0039EADA92
MHLLWAKTMFIMGYIRCLVAVGSVQVKEVCSNLPRGSVSLECGHPGRIHLVRVLYRKTSPGCVTQDDTCEYLQETQKQGLTTNCVGVSVCHHDIWSFWLTHKCGNTTSYTVTLSYQCINESPIDICSSTTTSSTEDSTLYLSSSNYPYESQNTYNTCQCDVTGTSMTVTILELFFRHRDGVRANITLKGDNSIWQSLSHRYFVYNTPVMENVSHFTVTFQTYGKQGQQVWLKVRGVSNLTVTCNGGTGPTSPTSPSPTTSSPHIAPIHTQGKTKMTLIVACAVGAVVFVLSVVTVIVCCKIVKRRRKTNGAETDATYTYYDHGVDHVLEPCDISESSDPDGRPDSDTNICNNTVSNADSNNGGNTGSHTGSHTYTNGSNNIYTNISDHLEGGHMYIRGNTEC